MKFGISLASGGPLKEIMHEEGRDGLGGSGDRGIPSSVPFIRAVELDLPNVYPHTLEVFPVVVVWQ